VKLPSEDLSTELDDFPSASPVRVAPGASEPEDGIGLCLSGGGYRAMLYHVGLLARLNEEGYLPKLDRISSVSGGSITAGVLAVNWHDLRFNGDGVATNFGELVTAPLRLLAHTRIDVRAVLGGAASPFHSISDRVVSKLDKKLFDGATLQNLPDKPRFIFNATNVESGVLMRFQKPYLADYRVGKVANPTLKLAEAVTASASFPPFLSPMELDLSEARWEDAEGSDLKTAGFRSEIFLSDGGVYDNMGLETVWKRYKTVMVSDAGGLFAADDEPARDWARHIIRVLQIMDSQVIPEGAGPVKSVGRSFFLAFDILAGASR